MATFTQTYPTDLKYTEWEQLAEFFPPQRRGRPRKWATWLIINAILYVTRTGCQWRLLPKDFPPWPVVYMTLYRQRQMGVWGRINAALRHKVREQAGKSPEPSVAILDSQTVKTDQKGGSVVTTAAKRSRAASATSRSTPWGCY